jgi:propionyl-CoA synthetase
LGVGAYESTYRRSLEDREAFWREAAAAVDWHSEPQRILDDSRPPFYRWFPDGVLNTCANAVDRHADGGRADQAALVYDSPVTGTIRVFTYAELRDEVATLAGALARLGVGVGRHGHRLHADGAGGGLRHARVCAARRDPLGRLRRLRRT